MNGERIAVLCESLAGLAVSGGAPAMVDHVAVALNCPVEVQDARGARLLMSGGSGRNGAQPYAAALRAGDASSGRLIAFVPTAGGDDATFEMLVRVAAAAIGRELHDAGPARRRDTFWERALDGVHHDFAAARDDAASRGIALAPAYLAIALEPGSDAGAPTAADLRALAQDALRGGDDAVGTVERGGALLVFVPAGREREASNARTAAALLPKTAQRRKLGVHFSGGVGSVETPLRLRAAVELAQNALAIGRRIFGPGAVAVYDRLGVYPLLYEGADARRLQTFASGVLEPLRTYDRKHQTELERTLRLYLEVGQNVKLAAERLHVHRHTVLYRLRQIGEIAGCSLENPHDQLTLRMAVAIDALHAS